MITVDDIMRLPPCSDYTRKQVEALWGNRTILTRSEILDLSIPAEDRVELVCRLLSKRTAIQAACDFVERVLHFWSTRYPADDRLAGTIRVARAYALGAASAEELRIARAAIKDAAMAVGWDAAEVVPGAAATGAAAWVAEAVVGAATGDAAWAAEAAAGAAGALCVAAGDAEAEAQITILRKYITGEKQ
jgi:hypothetical protein